MHDEIAQAKIQLYVALISVPSEELNYFEAEILLILAKDPVVQNRRMQVGAWPPASLDRGHRADSTARVVGPPRW
jgi:hypothetical protein